MLRLLLVAAASLGCAFVVIHESPRARDYLDSLLPRSELAPPPTTAITANHALALKRIPAPVDWGSGGAIDAVGEHVFLITRRGVVHLLSPTEEMFQLTGIAPPVDVVGQEALAERQVQKSSIGIKDLIVRQFDDGFEVTVSYVDLKPDDQCVTIAVARAVVAPDQLFKPHSPDWTNLYRSVPCVSLDTAFLLQSGGALDYAPDGTLYLFVGEFGYGNLPDTSAIMRSQAANTDLGKVIAIRTDGTAEHVSSGHRNPGGMTITSDGRIFVTEHGPQGGDELNLVTPGADYGWPIVTYGAEYGDFVWHPDPAPGQHLGFQQPILSWAPSIGVSSVSEYQGNELDLWQGNLIVATLRSAQLRRLILAEGRVVLDEPVSIGARVRDHTIAPDGRIFVKFDKQPVVLAISNANQLIDDIPKGLAQCVSCHQVRPGDTAEYAGPTLVGVFNRPIASVQGFEYSEALSRVSGRWSEDMLLNYLTNIAFVAPGSSMPQIEFGMGGAIAAIGALRKISEGS